MKACLIGLAGLPLGKRNIKDPRLDQAHKLVEADKKAYAQMDLVGEDELLTSDLIIVAQEKAFDVVFPDLELVETRLGRAPQAAERLALEKLKAHLEAEQPMGTAPLSADERQALSALTFVTSRPMVVVQPEELANPEPIFVRALAAAGYISFLTVGGKENRAWPIKKGETAWEAAGSIHSDIQKGFIRAEVIGWDDFVANGGETGAKRAGKQRLETKTYVMQDYDVVNYRFNK